MLLCQCNLRLAKQSERLHAEPQVDAHSAAVVGVACDACNRMAVSVSQDGDVKRWGFKALKLHSELLLGCEALHLCLHPHSMLAALCCSDHVVRIVDAEQMVVVSPTPPLPQGPHCSPAVVLPGYEIHTVYLSTCPTHTHHLSLHVYCRLARSVTPLPWLDSDRGTARQRRQYG